MPRSTLNARRISQSSPTTVINSEPGISTSQRYQCERRQMKLTGITTSSTESLSGFDAEVEREQRPNAIAGRQAELDQRAGNGGAVNETRSSRASSSMCSGRPLRRMTPS